MKVKRKNGSHKSTTDTNESTWFWNMSSSFILLILLVGGFFVLFSFLIFQSHFQLHLQSSLDPKIFVFNNITKIEQDIVSTESSSQFRSYPISKTSENKYLPKYRLSCSLAEKYNLSYWSPVSVHDKKYKSPFQNIGFSKKYVTFEPDVGGWNNIRMQMELVLVFAAATGRILVLPPDQPMYLLNKGREKQKAHSFAEFFPFDLIDDRMEVISMKEYLAREAITGHLRDNHTHEIIFPPENRTEFVGTIRDDRLLMWDYLRNSSSCPWWKSTKDYVVIPSRDSIALRSFSTGPRVISNREKIFAAGRNSVVYDQFWQEQKTVHFISKPAWDLRLLEHFYTFIFFESEEEDRHFKRFVRDTVHYIDLIFCKAAIIIDSLYKESPLGYSAFHIRRGEFQYKVVKISSEKMMENVGHHIPENELLYIASDEKNKSFFDGFRTRFPRLRFLDDYMDLANLRDINPNYLGMIDQVICTRGHYFVGTWFSTFSGYITRMRGYMGFHDYTVYYGDVEHRYRFHHDEMPKFPFYMREWNVSWTGIDTP